MVRVINYQTVSKFVNVVQRKLYTLFAGLGVDKQSVKYIDSTSFEC